MTTEPEVVAEAPQYERLTLPPVLRKPRVGSTIELPFREEAEVTNARFKDDIYFLGLSRYVAARSKDPSTKVGAVIVRPNRTVAATGYNGFARGVEDSADRLSDRPTKHAFTVHAEVNAIVTAREPLDGYTLYVTPFQPCSNCASVIVQSGIRRVVVLLAKKDDGTWKDSFQASEQILREGGVQVDIYSSHDREVAE